MYVAGVMADAGWDIYFPHRDRGFDMIVSREGDFGTIVRPIQVKGKYASDEKTDKARYGFVGPLTRFHDDMILAIPFFTSADKAAPSMIAWMPRGEIRPRGDGWRCEPAAFRAGAPTKRPQFAPFFDDAGLVRMNAEPRVSIL